MVCWSVFVSCALASYIYYGYMCVWGDWDIPNSQLASHPKFPNLIWQCSYSYANQIFFTLNIMLAAYSRTSLYTVEPQHNDCFGAGGCTVKSSYFPMGYIHRFTSYLFLGVRYNYYYTFISGLRSYIAKGLQRKEGMQLHSINLNVTRNS